MGTPFHRRVQDWIADTRNVNWAYYMGGGWERWAQGGICLSLMQLPNNSFARCEVLAYTNNQRADIVFRNGDNLDHWDIVELKCCKRWEDKSESLLTFLSSTRVGEDVQTAVETQIKPAYMGNTRTKWAIGLFALRDVRDYFNVPTLTMISGMARVQEKFSNLKYKDRNGNLVQVPATHLLRLTPPPHSSITALAPDFSPFSPAVDDSVERTRGRQRKQTSRHTSSSSRRTKYLHIPLAASIDQPHQPFSGALHAGAFPKTFAHTAGFIAQLNVIRLLQCSSNDEETRHSQEMCRRINIPINAVLHRKPALVCRSSSSSFHSVMTELQPLRGQYVQAAQDDTFDCSEESASLVSPTPSNRVSDTALNAEPASPEAHDDDFGKGGADSNIGTHHSWVFWAAEFFNLLWPLLFLILGLFTVQLNNQPKSSWGGRVVTANSIAPSIWPILFAGVVGSTSKAVAKREAHHGKPLSFVRQLLESQTVMETFKAAFPLAEFSYWSIVLLLLWSFSPLGSQASLRSIYLKDSMTVFVPDQQPSYANSSFVQEWKTAAELQQPTKYGTSPLGVTISLWFAALRSRDAGTQYSANDATMAQNIRSGSDGWENVRIPRIELLDGYDEQKTNWIDVKRDVGTVNYASLIGLPVADVPTVTNGTISFPIEANYHNFKCDDWHIISVDANEDAWMDDNYHKIKDLYSPDAARAPWIDALTLAAKSLGGLHTFIFDVDSTVEHIDLSLSDAPPTTFKGQNQYFGFPIQSENEDITGWQFTKCATSLSYVEAIVSYNYTNGVPSNPIITRMKRMADPPSTLDITPYDLDGINWSLRTLFVGHLAYQKLGNRTVRSMFQNFLADPAAFAASEGRQLNIDKLPIAMFEQRFALMSNSLWRAYAYPLLSTSPRAQSPFPDTQMTKTSATANVPADPRYALRLAWIIIYLIATFLMSVTAIVGFVIRLRYYGRGIPRSIVVAILGSEFAPKYSRGRSQAWQDLRSMIDSLLQVPGQSFAAPQ